MEVDLRQFKAYVQEKTRALEALRPFADDAEAERLDRALRQLQHFTEGFTADDLRCPSMREVFKFDTAAPTSRAGARKAPARARKGRKSTRPK